MNASTLTDIAREGRPRWSVVLRRVTVAVLTLVVLVGGSGFLGVRSATATASGSGYELRVEYARIARAGLDVPWAVTVRHAGGFGDEITLAVSRDYFDIFETQAFFPGPDAEAGDARTLYLTFAAPPGDTFTVSYDAYIQPSSQRGRTGTVAVLVDRREIVRAKFTTWLVP